MENLMRHLFHAIVVIPLLGASALAQSQDAKNKPATQEQASKETSSQTGNASQPPAGKGSAQQPEADHSMADFNVLGSTAQAAFGHDGP
jgi:hypothetical protein